MVSHVIHPCHAKTKRLKPSVVRRASDDEGKFYNATGVGLGLGFKNRKQEVSTFQGVLAQEGGYTELCAAGVVQSWDQMR